MTNNLTQQEEIVFEAAQKLADPAQRRAFLEAACAGNPSRRQRLEELLAVQGDAEKFFQEGTPGWDPGEEGRSISTMGNVGARIGRYKLREKIGEGGCGVVYVAEQEEPLRRRVALKIIKLGMDTKSVVARFEAERQALAMMDHPNIAKMLEAGATENGRPFFVMELVRGTKITAYCDQNHLTTRARLELFVKICQGVQHAHQKGIIHRDLKPSNILVVSHDGVPVPKIIDFGIAKAIEGRLTDRTIYTELHQFIGTPTYMSPEQAGMSGLDIDTRSDIYSLGVLLYELLTGGTPFDTKELLQSGFDEMRRIIRETEPLKPSTRLAREHVAIDVRRRPSKSEIRNLKSEIDPDLDWIVMKCLEKDRTHRYETATDLAADVQRHLNNQPVVACPPNPAYRFRKLARRHKLVLVSATAIVVSLGLAFFVSTALYLRTEIEATKSTQVAQFLKDMLGAIDPSVALGRDTTILRGILDQASARVEKELKNQPEIEAELLVTIGQAYAALGQSSLAQRLFSQSLSLRENLFGPKHLAVAESLDFLVRVVDEDTSRAETLARRALAIRRELLGDSDLRTVQSLRTLARVLDHSVRRAEVETLYRNALRVQKSSLGPKHPIVAECMSSLAGLLITGGECEEAQALLEEVLNSQRTQFGAVHPEIAVSLRRLGALAQKRKDFPKAELSYRQALEMNLTLFGWEHPVTIRSLEDLAAVLKLRDDLASVKQLLVELTQADPQGPNLLGGRANLCARLGQWDLAIADLNRAIRMDPSRYDLYHPLAALLVRKGEFAAYARLCQQILVRFGNTTEARIAERASKDCSIAPVPGLDIETVNRLTEIAVNADRQSSGLPWSQLAKALAQYRQLRFAAAANWAREALRKTHPVRDIEAYVVLAMSLHKLGQTEESRRSLNQGTYLAHEQLDCSEQGDLGKDWLDWIIVQALLREATDMIQGETTPPESDATHGTTR